MIKKRGTPNPVADHHAASYPKWILTAMINQLPAEAVGWRSPLGSCRPITLYKSFKKSIKTIQSQKHTFKKLDQSFPGEYQGLSGERLQMRAFLSQGQLFGGGTWTSISGSIWTPVSHYSLLR